MAEPSSEVLSAEQGLPIALPAHGLSFSETYHAFHAKLASALDGSALLEIGKAAKLATQEVRFHRSQSTDRQTLMPVFLSNPAPDA
jgi:hypothetical protein